ncbi:MAG TPA: DnaB-like helicase N-terminal domain-containing protein [Candidatus Aquirickettsiella sp.]|jgi:replicative DNA helicase
MNTVQFSYSLQAEQAILGGLLLDNITWSVISDHLVSKDFYQLEHQILFDKISKKLKKGEKLMREFAKISSEFWTSPLGRKIKSCELEAKVLTFYLMTCRHANMMGVYYLPLSLASHETGISLGGVARQGNRA